MAARQKPVSGPRPETTNQAFAIIAHPAFRIGFLDAQGGKPFAHDHILDRIQAETPPRALQRIPYNRAVDVCQYRYEEGRRLALEYGLRCKSWWQPDYPPASVVAWVNQKFGKAKS